MQRHLRENQLVMTSNEILKADVLDIVFDNRHKNYGAYLLRKYYNNRLGIALGGMLGFVLTIVLIISLNPSAREAIANSIRWNDTVTLSTIPVPPPEPPPATPLQQRVRQVASSTNIVIADETDVHTQQEISEAAVSGTDVAGPALAGATQPSLPENTNNQPSTIQETPPPPLPNSAASFPGGQQAWMNFLNKYLRTPDELEAGQKRTVLVRFAVGEDGSITKFEIIQSGGAAFDNEVIRVLKKMPKWKPAVQNGQNVSVMFTQPVTFMAYEE